MRVYIHSWQDVGLDDFVRSLITLLTMMRWMSLLTTLTRMTHMILLTTMTLMTLLTRWLWWLCCQPLYRPPQISPSSRRIDDQPETKHFSTEISTFFFVLSMITIICLIVTKPVGKACMLSSSYWKSPQKLVSAWPLDRFNQLMLMMIIMAMMMAMITLDRSQFWNHQATLVVGEPLPTWNRVQIAYCVRLKLLLNT